MESCALIMLQQLLLKLAGNCWLSCCIWIRRCLAYPSAAADAAVAKVTIYRLGAVPLDCVLCSQH